MRCAMNVLRMRDGQTINAETGELVSPDTGGIFVRHPFHRLRVQVDPVGDSLTQEAHVDATDINRIVKRFQETGQLPPPRQGAQYGDVTSLQGDTTDLINQSRAILDTVDQGMKTAKAREQAAAKPAEPPAPAVSPAPAGAPPAAPVPVPAPAN